MSHSSFQIKKIDEKNLRMERKIWPLSFIFFLLNSLFAFGEETIKLRLSNPMEIGKENLMFASVVSVCEDERGNFFVLDKLEHKVYKFNSGGEQLLSFGNEGQGPGDFQRPNHIPLTVNGDVVVADDLY
jgi:hypothetical protein